MLKKMTIKNRLFVLALVACFGLFLISVKLIYNEYSLKNEYYNLKELVVLSTKISKLVHETQKERGMTAGFLGSKGKKFATKIVTQRENTTKRFTELKTFVNNNDINAINTNIANYLQKALDQLTNLNNIRNQVNNFEISLKQALAYYTNINTILLNSVIQITKISNSKDISQELNAYINFLLAKERAGIERAVGAATLGGNKFAKGMKVKFVSLIAAQDSYLNNFLEYATKKTKDYFNNTLKGNDINEVNRIRKILLQQDKDFGVDATYWFSQITGKTNKLKQIDDYLANDLLKTIDIKYNQIVQDLIITLVLSIVVTIFVFILAFFIIQNISQSLKTFEKGLLEFFSFVNNERNNVELIKLNSNDEISQMATIVNENIKRAKHFIDENNMFINEVKNIVNEINKGKLHNKITAIIHDKNLQELKESFNHMLEVLANKMCYNINKIEDALNNFQQLNFTHRIDKPQGLTAKGLNELANTINDMLIKDYQNGKNLSQNASKLLENVKILSTSTSSSASALEETAVALEQIASTISNTTQNVMVMSQKARELEKSSVEGEKLANQTIDAMNEIDEQVGLINEAISVIDQIAFQTNILSLNAAVEAATAGEAGKGFAVVAGEVRNLAARSAEAANEIKKLVENATNKAHDGKDISNSMIEGYKHLSENIRQTLTLIENIANASKEQEQSILQINNSIADLDNQTQKNVEIANNTEDIAIKTDKISQIIIKEVMDKDFIGKNTL